MPSCYVTTNCIGEPINSSITFAECCTTYGVSYNLDGRCQPCPYTSKCFVTFKMLLVKNMLQILCNTLHIILYLSVLYHQYYSFHNELFCKIEY